MKYLPLAVNERRFAPSGVDSRENKIIFAGSVTESRLKTLNRLAPQRSACYLGRPKNHELVDEVKKQKLGFKHPESTLSGICGRTGSTTKAQESERTELQGI